MKKVTIMVLLMLAPVFAFAQKFGQVDSGVIIQALPDYTQAQNELQQLQKLYEDELKDLNDEYTRKVEEYESQPETLPDNIRQRREQEIMELQQKMNQFYNNCQENLQRTSAEKMQAITEKVLKAIQEVGNEGGYICVFDNADAAVPYISSTLCTDVTDAVKAKLGIQ